MTLDNQSHLFRQMEKLESMGASMSPGPLRDECADREYESQFGELLDRFPSLAFDPVYHDFLANFDEVLLQQANANFSFSVFGFTYFWFDIIENDYSLVDPKGYVEIARIQIAGPAAIAPFARVVISFAREALAARGGVYAGAITDKSDLALFEYRSYCKDFASWLDEMIEQIEKESIVQFCLNLARR